MWWATFACIGAQRFVRCERNYNAGDLAATNAVIAEKLTFLRTRLATAEELLEGTARALERTVAEVRTVYHVGEQGALWLWLWPWLCAMYGFVSFYARPSRTYT